MPAMSHATIEVATEDGKCPAHVFHPAGSGPWPGVLLYMDGIGIRPALFAMAERLASAGYYVLVPDLFYRSGPYTAPDPAKLFADPAMRTEWFTKFFAHATSENIMRDTKAFLAHFADQKMVKPGKLGTTGYCMGGRMALAAAGHFPDRFAACASYHGGNIANDAPDSPHLLASKMKARVYVAAADNDPPEQTQRLGLALAAAGVEHAMETYPAKHGWVPSDTPVHDAAQAERHWRTLLALFSETLN
jgi:carboxymethylenebutenolidase